MILAIVVLLSLMIIIGAIVAIKLNDMVGAIIAAGVVSLLASVLYLIYGAPDVAMTEASIGSALTTVVFFLHGTELRSLKNDKKSFYNNFISFSFFNFYSFNKCNP